MELKNLLLYRSLKFQFKEVSYEDLIKIKANFDELVNERLEELEAQKKAKEENEKKLQDAVKALKDMGISPEEFIASMSGSEARGPSSRKGIKMEPKYKYPDPDNEEISLFWTGQGKIPNKLAKLLSKTGKELEAYKI